jgi:hypothetical protein
VRLNCKRVCACLLVANVAAAALGCGAGPKPISGTPRLVDTLTKLISDAYDFSRPGIVERMAGLYADSGSVVSASGGTMMANRDSIISGIARFWENVGQNM